LLCASTILSLADADGSGGSPTDSGENESDIVTVALEIASLIWLRGK